MTTPALESDFDGTFPFASKFFAATGGRMAYVDRGTGEPVVLLHGNPTWGYLYRRFIPPLTAAHRVVVPDYIGFGRSQKPAFDLKLADHIRNLTDLLLHLDLHNITLVMQDWGGPIGLGFATEYPERVKALVAMNTWAFRIRQGTPLHPLLEQFRIPGIGEALVQGMNLFVEGFLPSGIHHRDKITDTMMRAYRAPFPDFNSRAPVLAFPRDIPVGEEHPSTATMGAIEDHLKTLAENHVPMLIVWGMRDIALPPALIDLRWLKYFPHAEVHRLENASHFLQEDEPELIVRLILDFLNRHPQGH